MNITRIDFLKNISNNNIKELMCNFFEQNMALYNLIYKNIDKLFVSCDIIDRDIYFYIKSNDIQKEALELNIKEWNTVSCYGKTYNLNINISKDLITIRFIEVAY